MGMIVSEQNISNDGVYHHCRRGNQGRCTVIARHLQNLVRLIALRLGVDLDLKIASVEKSLTTSNHFIRQLFHPSMKYATARRELGVLRRLMC